MTQNAPSATRRIYTDSLTVNPELDRRDLLQQVHALYTHWLRRNFHPRDFVAACDHCARYIIAELLAGDRLALTPGAIPFLELAPQVTHSPFFEPKRFYDEVEAISPEADTDQMLKALQPLFAQWVSQGWNARDFAEVVRMCASDVLYMHRLAREMGGLGGGPSGPQFLSQPYRG